MNTDITSLLTDNLIGGLKGLAAGAAFGAILYEPVSNYRIPKTALHKIGFGALMAYGADFAALAGLNIGSETNWQNNLGITLGFALGYTIAEKIRDKIDQRSN